MGCWNPKWFKMLCHPSRWNKCPTCVGVDAGWENSLMDDEWQRLAGSCEFTKPLNSWTVVQLLDDFSAHICGRLGARSSFWTGKLVWNVHRVEPGCCVMCSGRLFAWLGPWNHADFPRSPFNQRCFFAISPGACLGTRDSTAFLACVLIWVEMCHDSCLWSKNGPPSYEECGLKRVRRTVYLWRWFA